MARRNSILDWFTEPNEPDVVVVNEGRRESVISEDDLSIDFYDPVPMPTIGDFRFKSIIKHAQSATDVLVQDIDDLAKRYQDGLSRELLTAAVVQDAVTAKMADVEHLASKSVGSAHTLLAHAESSSKLKKEMDLLVAGFSSVRSSIDSLLASLKRLDELLPPADKLESEDSPHREHYPLLHAELRQAEMQSPQDSVASSRPSLERDPLRSTSSLSLPSSETADDVQKPYSLTPSRAISSTVSTESVGSSSYTVKRPVRSAKEHLSHLIKQSDT